jgi:hypothetical protein
MKTFLEGIENRRTDIAEDDAERGDRESKVGF